MLWIWYSIRVRGRYRLGLNCNFQYGANPKTYLQASLKQYHQEVVGTKQSGDIVAGMTINCTGPHQAVKNAN